jgi:hypothetical protein
MQRLERDYTLYLPDIQEGVGVAHVKTHTRIRLRGGGHQGGGKREFGREGEARRERRQRKGKW